MAASEIPWALIAPLIALYLILVISALVNCSKQEELNGPKWLWLLIIAGISFIGPISYFVIGKRRHM
ncbi:Negative regulatory protein YxlE [Bacillus glycinifermentans]|uniref:PLDc N-terminal domain-containing protein n=1 Tax=Bacillus glycinifermentans TaxID=1664069 RepID=A0A0J6E600_9BACI|nr:PLDc N-terminal domain-containing protein [Bacillus glycinifermentans]ATH93717.1 transcriptional regulator [Bacillus glycinifermentans]KMM56726.1 Negative regulatory protein YxlE [Bacillus glycinifermentans]KRT90106.1 transcriptional regulator [Bacillus glycinifermentans]MEC0483790.1 PLDc N-terminal domain-containing protein [Bacillus glycinifermentans]MEC0496284.1 PLDc N-terminal domain-containing protein [Bacillus glycinifermentans]